MTNKLDGIIDTVSAKHDFVPLFGMLKPKVSGWWAVRLRWLCGAGVG